MALRSVVLVTACLTLLSGLSSPVLPLPAPGESQQNHSSKDFGDGGTTTNGTPARDTGATRLREAQLDAIFLAYLQTGYARKEVVSGPYVHIVDRKHHGVGDVPVYQVQARINREDKTAVAFLNEDTGEVISEQMPTYFQVSHSVVDYELANAMKSSDASVVFDLFVTLKPRESALSTADFYPPERVPTGDYPSEMQELLNRSRNGEEWSNPEASRYEELVRQYVMNRNELSNTGTIQAFAEEAIRAGASAVELPDRPLSPRIGVRGTGDVIQSLASNPSVSGIYWDHPGDESFFLDQSRIASGTAAANDAGFLGQGKDLVLFDSGINPVTIQGVNRLPVADNRSWAPGEPSFDDVRNHGTSIAWIMRGNPPSPNVLIGLAKASILYNAKIIAQNGLTAGLSGFTDALDLALTTWSMDVGTSSIGNTTYNGGNGDDGNFWRSKLFDYYINNYGFSFSQPTGNSEPANRIYAPGGAYNLVTVGAYDDFNDGSHPGFFYLAPFSPTSSTADGRKKPDVIEPGVKINTYLNNGGTTGRNGTSFSTPHAAASMAVIGSAWGGGARSHKCALVNSVVFSNDNFQAGWGWGIPSTYNGVYNTSYVVNTADQGQSVYLNNIFVPTNRKVWATLVWYREMVDVSTVRRVSDLDLRLRYQTNGTLIDDSLSSLDNVERVSYLVPPGQPATMVQLEVYGFNVRGLGPQTYVLCYGIRPPD